MAGLKGFWEAVRKTARQKPLLFAALAIACLAIALFWNTLLVVLKGFLYAAIAMACIFAAILLWAKMRYRQPSLKQLFAEKKRLLASIKIAEKRYLKRRLSEQDFNSIFKEKQRSLIETEAVIDQRYNEKEGEAGRQLLAVQAKKRHILQSLLGEKKRLIKEMGLAEKRYLRRKIDAKTYQGLVQGNQGKLVDLEAQIDQLYNEANVSKVMDSLKQKLTRLEKQEKTAKKKTAKQQRKEQLRIAKEIASQVSKR